MLLISFLVIQQAPAQTYHPLLTDSSTWDTYHHNWSLPACSVTGTDRSFVNGDTLINSVLYSKISAYSGVNITPMPCPVWAYDNTSFYTIALMREDTASKKVWRYNESIGEEFLLFDFSVMQGDTFITSFGWDTALSPDTFIVDSTSALLMLDSSFRKIIHMTFNNGVILHEFMIEGIGGSAGLYNPPMNYGIGFESSMGCVIKSGITLTSGVIYPPFQPYPVNCPYLIGHTNRIKGNAFVDLNSNNIYDGNDAPLAYKKITESFSGMFDFTDGAGNYEVFVTDTGNFAVSGQILNNFSSNPSVNTSYFPAYLLIDSLNDFAYQPLSIFNDLEIYLFNQTKFRSGYNGYYKIRVKNTGTTSLSPTVVLHPDNNLQYSSATLNPAGVAIDSVYWNLPPLAPFQQLDFTIVMSVAAGLVPGTNLLSFAEALPIVGDATQANNISIADHFVSNSFDPNDISVDKDTILSIELPNPPFLNYIIRFQNTGNDTTYIVTIDNPISNFLDMATFEFVGASHPVDIHWNHFLNQIEFSFDNILLPDSNTNVPESHGFILYRIKPKITVPVNSFILNRVSIYFDLNQPILTNYAQTVIATPTGIQDLPVNARNVIIYPNPFNEALNIRYSKGVCLISVMDLSGRLIFETPVSKLSEETMLNTSQLTKGIYLLKLTGGDSIVVKKVIKL